ncbi:MAG TPA: hypothetical protein PK748_09855 [Acidimicrobiales bacterium]|jgi:hypothetical protein|nr:hypothetical protein [Acidimicrobiales bacterium]HMS88012.1 hypothetical protein [Acidimicrobiales bacterium]HRA35224.1 hypothetical protein [Acidimicrobiales bacterium]
MALVDHPDPPSWYFRVAWDLFLAVDDDKLDAITDEALRGYDHYELVRALALTAVPLIVALRDIGGTRRFDELVDDHLRAINEALTPKEPQLP